MKSSLRLFHWIPRIICILAILFISLFAADSFAEYIHDIERLRKQYKEGKTMLTEKHMNLAIKNIFGTCVDEIKVLTGTLLAQKHCIERGGYL